jgi:DnaK suppressor protein
MATAIRAARRHWDSVSEHYHQLEELRRQRSAELSARLRELRESASPSEPVAANDLEAQLDNASSAGVGAVLAAITSQTLQGIETALRRLRNGRYGTCSDCNSAIGEARLRALPFAERCRECQEFADARSGGFALAG